MNLHSEFSISPCIFTDLPPWYAIRTRSNQEKLVSTFLSNKGYEVYFPAYQVQRRWSDRIEKKELPLFPGYVFCRFDVIKRMPIITTPGVAGIIGFSNVPAAIPESEIEGVRIMLRSGLSVEPCSFLNEGERIRIKDGPLVGQEGILLKKKNEWRFVVSIHMLQRSISVEIDPYSLEAL